MNIAREVVALKRMTATAQLLEKDCVPFCEESQRLTKVSP